MEIIIEIILLSIMLFVLMLLHRASRTEKSTRRDTRLIIARTQHLRQYKIYLANSREVYENHIALIEARLAIGTLSFTPEQRQSQLDEQLDAVTACYEAAATECYKIVKEK